MTITAIPPLDRTAPTFRADCDTYFATSIPNFTTEINALALDLTGKQDIASKAAASATESAKTASSKAVEAGTSAGSASGSAKIASDSAAAAAASAATIGTSAAYSDATPFAKNATDATKQARMNLAGLTTGVIRTLTIPDKNGTLAMIDDLDARTRAFFNANNINVLDYNNGGHQRWAPGTGAQALVINNWPAAGTHGELMIEGVNLGAATITWPAINWIRYDGTSSPTFSYMGYALQSNGIDFIVLWTRLGSAGVFGKVVR
ncbi:hypothetical protein F2P45_09720 [Massilia sp. CCM 8733]|uniref:Tail fiber protein n=1 Tax=Massilia mucilaginosa TaxID=2609282 RepID=A0ABX0NR15_9BURK|nr:hypothetical protein [Massilia mucilaginosa]NHZ89288.1 hypothetical protein [Massilia mucilaginosa]